MGPTSPSPGGSQILGRFVEVPCKLVGAILEYRSRDEEAPPSRAGAVRWVVTPRKEFGDQPERRESAQQDRSELTPHSSATLGFGRATAPRRETFRHRALVPVLVLVLVVSAASPAAGFAQTITSAKPALTSLRPRSGSRLIKPLVPIGEVAPEPFSRWPAIHLHLARPNATATIVGGTDASQGQLGFMAFVVYSESSTTFMLCSATVVSPNVVLTAGHCAADESTGNQLDPSRFSVVTGTVDWTNSSVRHVTATSRVIVDPAYDPATHNSDAALLVLATPTTAPSIALASNADLGLEQAGTGAVMAGWGETYAGSAPPYVLK
jgi:hypothetical protein